MNKKISEVRKSIVKRNKRRDLNINKTESKNVSFPIFPEEEEKHGYFPHVTGPILNENKEGNFFYGILIKGIISVVLFFSVAVIQQSNLTLLSKPREWTSNVLTEEFPFARVSVWYQNTFGRPLAYAPEGKLANKDIENYALPVSGNVAETFQVNGSGIKISPQEATLVSSWDEGIVIFAGNDRQTNKTVVIQHPDMSKSTYAYLSSIDVHLYQSIKPNQRIGSFNPTVSNEVIYFSIEKDNQYIDPIKVIQVDDIP